MKELSLGNEDGPLIQFLHANAYTPECYKIFFQSFEDYHVVLPYQRPLWGTEQAQLLSSWHVFVGDIIDHMKRTGRKGVIGIGHSMGGVVSLLASVKNPELFRQLILIDPVILPWYGTLLFQLLPYSVKKKILPMVAIAAKRRSLWKDRKEAKEFLLTKKVFQRFDPDVLEDFVQFGLINDQNGVTLAYPGIWESHVYATAPYLWNIIHKVPCPITIVKAEYSDVIDERRWKLLQKKIPHGQFVEMKNVGHLVPFEQPAGCAEVILEVLGPVIS